MLEGFNKLMMFGLGAVDMTRQKAEEMFEECVQRGQVEQSRKEAFVKDLMDASERARTRLEDMMAEQVRTTIKKLDLATKEDVTRLEAKLDELLARCEASGPPSGPSETQA